ncbi:MAG TPA: FAD-dependent monooxygenase [Patescibacteria group bacterium]|nr:FAD-dependent monooxygenase [Patescibacteria group bacterium]
MRQNQTEVLVVGAGPIGLWSALLLAESGVEAIVIDREARTTARSYACALHPATLRLLDRFGLAESVIERGRRIETVAFYDGPNRQAEIHLSKLGGEFPFLLMLPQSALEGLLEQRLRAAGVSVQWNHRFEGVEEEQEGVETVIEELEGTSTGYIVPHWETVVKSRSTLRAQFLIGADGHNSMVRPRTNLEYQRFGNAQSFAAFEFETGETVPDELRVVLGDSGTNVLWPLPNNRCRWTFQIARSDFPGDFPEKDRRAVRLAEPAVDERIRQYVQKVSKQRAPWFNNEIQRVHWCTEVTFERRLAAQFGRNHCWLAGDAAHQTGPAGVQSMNMGFVEASSLTCAIKKILREGAPIEQLEGYNQDWQKEWHFLLGTKGGLKARTEASQWVAERSAEILPCLPAHGKELVALASQLQLAPVN